MITQSHAYLAHIQLYPDKVHDAPLSVPYRCHVQRVPERLPIGPEDEEVSPQKHGQKVGAWHTRGTKGSCHWPVQSSPHKVHFTSTLIMPSPPYPEPTCAQGPPVILCRSPYMPVQSTVSSHAPCRNLKTLPRSRIVGR